MSLCSQRKTRWHKRLPNSKNNQVGGAQHWLKQRSTLRRGHAPEQLSITKLSIYMNQEQEKKSSTTIPFQPIMLGCGILLVLTLTFWAGFGLGFGTRGWQMGVPLWAAAPANATANGRPASARAALEPKFDLFWEALDLVYRDFYGAVPDADTATYNAIRGVINNLDDPNTSFLTPQEADFFRTNIEGTFEGIGARVEWNEEADTLEISEPFENQPAWKAGLRRGDLVLAVDGQNVVGTSLNDTVAKIRGPKDTTVILTIRHKDATDLTDTEEIEVVRDRIETPTISTNTYGESGEIAYVRLFTFNQNAGQLVRQAVEDAMSRNPKALIFDLRGNSGGLLREAVKVANVFIEDQTVLLERFSDGKTETYQTSESAVAEEIPMVVLVNEGSASASEIVAGALQDSGRAPLIGTTTYGKGSVQLPHTLSDGSIMRVTIARWYTPKDRTIDGTGLEPDQVVELPEAARDTGKDPQLDAAVEYLTKLEE